VADANTVQALLDQPLDPAAWETLARRDGETAKAHAAFLEYVRMGPGRSLRKLHARYVDWRRTGDGLATEKPPTTRLRTLMEWSSRFEWQARLEAYAEERDRAAIAEWEARRQALREIDFQTGDELRDLAARILAETPQFLKTTRRLIKGRDGATDREIITVGIDIDAMLKALKLASDLQRAAAGLPAAAIEVRHDHRLDTDQYQRALESLAAALGTSLPEAGADGDGDLDAAER